MVRVSASAHFIDPAGLETRNASNPLPLPPPTRLTATPVLPLWLKLPPLFCCSRPVTLLHRRHFALRCLISRRLRPPPPALFRLRSRRLACTSTLCSRSGLHERRFAGGFLPVCIPSVDPCTGAVQHIDCHHEFSYQHVNDGASGYGYAWCAFDAAGLPTGTATQPTERRHPLQKRTISRSAANGQLARKSHPRGTICDCSTIVILGRTTASILIYLVLILCFSMTSIKLAKGLPEGEAFAAAVSLEKTQCYPTGSKVSYMA